MHRIRTEGDGTRIASLQFQTFRNQEKVAGDDEEREELMNRVRELQQEIRMVKERSRQLQFCNNKLNHIIVSYHTKNTSRFEHFKQKVNAICEKRNEQGRSHERRSHERRSNEKGNGLARKSNSSSKQLATNDPTTFGKTKGQFASINDQNNSYLGNMSSLITRQDVKKKLASKLAPSHNK